MSKIICREQEISTLKQLVTSKKAEYLGMYGRRRIGKTFLIQEYFLGKKYFYFEAIGEKEASLATQLHNFARSLSEAIGLGIAIQPPRSWDEAFDELNTIIDRQSAQQKIILFFDELPWFNSANVQMLTKLSKIWKTRWCRDKRIKLIVCGSAAAWMLKHVVGGKSEAHGLLTKQIHLEPFTVQETEKYLQAKNVKLDQYEVARLYMAFGGVARYLDLAESGRSTTEIIDRLCFHKNGLMRTEFKPLYASLFNESEEYIKVIRALAKNPKGLSRSQLIENTSSTSGGTFNNRLEELVESGFIVGAPPYGKQTPMHYRLLDEYSLFYLTFIEPNLAASKHARNLWSRLSQENKYKSWCGAAFEIICRKHVGKICQLLEVEHLYTWSGEWQVISYKKSAKKGAQIDLVIERSDDTVMLFEIKFYNKPYIMTDQYAEQINEKKRIFQSKLKKQKQILSCLITSSGVKKNDSYRKAGIVQDLSLADFFSDQL